MDVSEHECREPRRARQGLEGFTFSVPLAFRGGFVRLVGCDVDDSQCSNQLTALGAAPMQVVALLRCLLPLLLLVPFFGDKERYHAWLLHRLRACV